MVKLFGRAFQIYDDVVSLRVENFAKMKNGLGEDITEGCISFPIIYCVSKVRRRKMSIYSKPNEQDLQDSTFEPENGRSSENES